jgi:hypothetical protein
MWIATKDHGFTVGARLLQGEKLANAKFPPEKGRQKTRSEMTNERRAYKLFCCIRQWKSPASMN